MLLAAIDVKEVLLAWILKLGLVLVLIDVPLLSCQGICLPKLSGWIFADTVRLTRKGFDSDVGVEGFTLGYELKDMSFLKLFHSPKNKINAN